MKRICLISTVPTHPTNAGNRARILALANEYRNQGLDVHFLFLKGLEEYDCDALTQYWKEKLHIIAPERSWPLIAYPYKGLNQFYKKIIHKLQKWHNFPVDGWYPFKHHKGILKKINELSPDYVQVEYIFLSYLLKFITKSKTIIDTHDSHSNRHKKIKKNVWFSTSTREEIKALKRADFIIAITDKDASDWSNYIPNKKIINVGHISSVPPLEKSKNKTDQKRIGFIGSDNSVNLETINKLLDDFYQLPKQDFLLVISGSISSRIKNQIQTHENIKLYDYLALDSFFDKIDILYNPTFSSTGLKIKNVEALLYNKVLITTRDGAEGLLDGANTNFYCIEISASLFHVVKNINYNIDSREFIIRKMQLWKENLGRIFN